MTTMFTRQLLVVVLILVSGLERTESIETRTTEFNVEGRTSEKPAAVKITKVDPCTNSIKVTFIQPDVATNGPVSYYYYCIRADKECEQYDPNSDEWKKRGNNDGILEFDRLTDSTSYWITILPMILLQDSSELLGYPTVRKVTTLPPVVLSPLTVESITNNKATVKTRIEGPFGTVEFWYKDKNSEMKLGPGPIPAEDGNSYVQMEGLTPCMEYSIEVAALSNCSGGKKLEKKDFITLLGRPSKPRLDHEVHSYSEDQDIRKEVTISWTRMDEKCNDQINFANITLRKKGSDKIVQTVEEYTKNMYTLNVPEFATEYVAEVALVNIPEYDPTEMLVGEPAFEEFRSLSGKPTKPRVKEFTPSANEIRLIFEEPEHPNGIIIAYEYCLASQLATGHCEEEDNWQEFEFENLKPENLKHTFVDLESCVEYSLHLRAINMDVEDEVILKGEHSINVATTFTTVPPKFKPLTVDVPAESSSSGFIASVSWDFVSTFHCKTIYKIAAVPVSPSDNVGLRPVVKDVEDAKHVTLPLHAFTTYDITVASETSAGKGEPVITQITTPYSAPYDIEGLEVVEKGTTYFTIQWRMKTEKNGPRTISVDCSSLDSPEVMLQVDDLENIPEKTSIIYKRKVKSLKTYEDYSCLVAVANFEKKKEKRTEIIRTKPSSPETPSNFNVTCSSNADVNATWKMPVISHGIVDRFEIDCIGIRIYSNGTSEKTQKVEKFNANGTVYLEKLDLRPQFNYTFTIKAFNQDVDEAGKDSDEIYCYLEALSPFVNELVEIGFLEQKPTTTLETVDLTLPNDLFNQTNGEIRNFSVFMFADSTISEVSKEAEDVFWSKEILNSSIIKPYRLSPDGWNPYTEQMRTSKSMKFSLSSAKEPQGMCCHLSADKQIACKLGCDKSCEDSDEKTPCNGPLRPETDYRIVLRAYTDGGYKDTKALTVTTTLKVDKPTSPITTEISTSPEPEDGHDGSSVGITIDVATIALLLIVAVGLV